VGAFALAKSLHLPDAQLRGKPALAGPKSLGGEGKIENFADKVMLLNWPDPKAWAGKVSQVPG
jgi:hypothetical protein